MEILLPSVPYNWNHFTFTVCFPFFLFWFLVFMLSDFLFEINWGKGLIFFSYVVIRHLICKISFLYFWTWFLVPDSFTFSWVLERNRRSSLSIMWVHKKVIFIMTYPPYEEEWDVIKILWEGWMRVKKFFLIRKRKLRICMTMFYTCLLTCLSLHLRLHMRNSPLLSYQLPECQKRLYKCKMTYFCCVAVAVAVWCPFLLPHICS